MSRNFFDPKLFGERIRSYEVVSFRYTLRRAVGASRDSVMSPSMCSSQMYSIVSHGRRIREIARPT